MGKEQPTPKEEARAKRQANIRAARKGAGPQQSEAKQKREKLAELQQRLSRTAQRIRVVERSQMTAQQERELEALRRQRMRLLLHIDRLTREPKQPIWAAAPKAGIRSVSQGGSPGLGGRA